MIYIVAFLIISLKWSYQAVFNKDNQWNLICYRVGNIFPNFTISKVSIKDRIKSGFHFICSLDMILHMGPKGTTKANFHQNSKWVLMLWNELKFITFQREFLLWIMWPYCDVIPLFFGSLSDGCHTDLVCQAACCYWCHPFSYCSGPFKISRNQQGSSIFPFSMTPSIINCNFSFPAGLTLTPRQETMDGNKGTDNFQTDTVGIYCSITTHSNCQHICGWLRECVLNNKIRKGELKYLYHVCKNVYSYSRQATPKSREEKEKKHKHVAVCTQKVQRWMCAAPKTSFIWHGIKNVWRKCMWFSYNACHITKWQVFQLSNNDLFGNSIVLRKRVAQT